MNSSPLGSEFLRAQRAMCDTTVGRITGTEWELCGYELDERSNRRGSEQRLFWLPPQHPWTCRPTWSAVLLQPPPQISVPPSHSRTLNSGLITHSWCSGSQCVSVTGKLYSSLRAFAHPAPVTGILFPPTFM